MKTIEHIPVLIEPAIKALNIQKNCWYVDATVGLGGHTSEILKRSGNVIVIDQDERAIEHIKDLYTKEIADNTLLVFHTNFSNLFTVVKKAEKKIHGILFDFGVNSMQLDTAERGFSFQKEYQLDMRMSQELAVTAKDLINGLGRKELYDLLINYVQEFRARKIVDAFLRARKVKPIETTKELADIIEKAVGNKRNVHSRIHPATKTFLALRIAVNDELRNIEQTLPIALDVLQNHGRIVAISFHQSEDRIVKRAMKRWEQEEIGTQITKKPITPLENEIRLNLRSRSAKMRIFEKG